MRHENFAGNADDIADVVFFEFRIRLVAQNVALKVKLNLTVAVKDMRETCLAHNAFADKSSGKRHGFALVFFKIIDDFFGHRRFIEADFFERIFARVLQIAQFVAANLDKFA